MELIVGTAALARRLEDADARTAALASGSSPARVVGLGMNGPVTESDLDSIETFCFAHQSYVNIDLCPLADPSLADLLGRRGYRVTEFNNVLVRPLALPALFNDAAIEQVTADSLEEWARALAEGFSEREPIEEELDVGRNLFGIAGCTAFIARIDGRPAAGGAMMVHSGLAILFGDATPLAFRRRGLQSALIDARLAHSVLIGCDMATAAAVPGSTSHRNYERRGFRVAYTKMTMQREYRR